MGLDAIPAVVCAYLLQLFLQLENLFSGDIGYLADDLSIHGQFEHIQSNLLTALLQSLLSTLLHGLLFPYFLLPFIEGNYSHPLVTTHTPGVVEAKVTAGRVPGCRKHF